MAVWPTDGVRTAQSDFVTRFLVAKTLGIHVQTQQQDTWPNRKVQPSDTRLKVELDVAADISTEAIRLLASVLLATCQALDLAIGNKPGWLLPYMVCSGKLSSQPAIALKVKRGWEF